MNKIYKVLTNRRTGQRAAVSELQRTHTKHGPRLALLAAAVLGAAVASGPAAAYNWYGTSPNISLSDNHNADPGAVNSGFAFGSDAAAKTYDSVRMYGGSYRLYFEGLTAGAPTKELNLDADNALSLLDQSQGFSQALVQADGGIWWALGALPQKLSVDSNYAGDIVDSNVFVQKLAQGGVEEVAWARYLIGQRAKNLSPSSVFGDFDKMGMRIENGNTISTAAILAEVELRDGKTLTIDATGGGDWGAHLTGNGAVRYEGSGRGDEVTIGQIFYTEENNTDHLAGANNYGGGTTIVNATLRLKREASLGTGDITADNARIIEGNDTALIDVANITFTTTDLELAGAFNVSNTGTFTGANTISNADVIFGTLCGTDGASLAVSGHQLQTGTLDITNTTLSAGNLLVTGVATVSGTDSVFSTTSGATLESGLALTDGTGLRVAAGGLRVENGLSLDNGVLTVETGGLTVTNNLTLTNSAAKLDLQGGDLKVQGDMVLNERTTFTAADASTVSVTGDVTLKDAAAFTTDDLALCGTLRFEGSTLRTYGTTTATMDADGYAVELNGATVRYTGTLSGVTGTKLTGSTLTLALAHADKDSLGDAITFATGSRNNLLSLEFSGTQAFGGIATVGSVTGDIIEFRGTGDSANTISFGDEAFSDYAGWIRFSNTSFNLNEGLSVFSEGSNVGLGIGPDAVVSYEGTQTASFNRIGWRGDDGVLDLSKFDFSTLDATEGAITVQTITLNGLGSIWVNKTAITGLSADGESSDSTIFDAQDSKDRNLVIKSTNLEVSGDYTISVRVEGLDSGDNELTAFFNQQGRIEENGSAETSAASGTWGFTTWTDANGVSIQHGLEKVRLLGGDDENRALTLDVGLKDERLEVLIEGDGILKKDGTGTLRITNRNTFKGDVEVVAGTLIAVGGGLGTGINPDNYTPGTGVALTVKEGATYAITPTDAAVRQNLEGITVESGGSVELGGSSDDAELGLFGVSTFKSGSTVTGGSSSFIGIADGVTVTFEDFQTILASGWDGSINFADAVNDEREGSGKLVLLQDKGGDGVGTLDRVRGSGTIELADQAVWGDLGDFTGRMVVNNAVSELTINADSVVNAAAALEMTSGQITVDNLGTKVPTTFGEIDLTGGTINLGTLTGGADWVTGGLRAEDSLKLENVKVKVDYAEGQSIDAANILSLDNEDGKTTMLIGGTGTVADSVTIDGITIEGNGDALTSALIQDGNGIGTVTYAAKVVKDSGLGVNFQVTELWLTDVLNLNGTDRTGEDATLDLMITGTGTGGLKITAGTVTLAQANEYGSLEVFNGATGVILGTQRLANGGAIAGKIIAENGAKLSVEGGTLKISVHQNEAYDIDLASGATLAFDGVRTSGDLFAGEIKATDGVTVTFNGSKGNFALASDSVPVAYELSGSSEVTFSATPVDGALSLGEVKVDDVGSTARFEVDGSATETSLKDVSGEGTVRVSFNQGQAAGLTLFNVDGFTGTFGWDNATLTIGTAENTAANVFATEKGSLLVGKGSTLVVNNDKTEKNTEGAIIEKPVELNGNLTLWVGSTVDFTTGIHDLSGDDDVFVGHQAGVSLNAIDMQGNDLSVRTDLGTGSVMPTKFVMDLGHLDLSTGFVESGFKGSILDLIGSDAEVPILTVVQNVGQKRTAGEMAAIASSIQLEGTEDNPTSEFDFFQPDWKDGETGVATPVAKVKTSPKLVVVSREDGGYDLAVGVGITEIDMVSGATLRIDASKTLLTKERVMDASISGGEDVKVVITNNLVAAESGDTITLAAANTYRGTTDIGYGAKVLVNHWGALENSSQVRVGVLGEERTSTVESTLTLAESSGNPIQMKLLKVGAKGIVELKSGNTLVLNGPAEDDVDTTLDEYASTVDAAGKIKTEENSEALIVLASGRLKLADIRALEDFKGTLSLQSGSTLEVNVDAGANPEWNPNYVILPYTDESSGTFEKVGKGGLPVADGTLADVNVLASEGSMTYKNATVGSLTVRRKDPASTDLVVQQVEGLLTVDGDLTAGAGNIFVLDVVTGKDMSGDPDYDPAVGHLLGDNDSDGIRVKGTAKGTLNLAVNPVDVNSGAEERIQLMTAALIDDTDFEVQLADEETGAVLPGIEAGGYDYVLVREDGVADAGRSGAGTKIWLSSLADDNGTRNTTVNAGSYLGVAAAATLFDLSIHDRMSNRSWLKPQEDGSVANAFWIVEQVSHERFSDSTGQIDVRNTASATTIGADLLTTKAGTGDFYAGVLFGWATEDTKSCSNRTNLESRADTEAWGVGLYAGWQQNAASRVGPYVDGWLMWTTAEADVKGINVDETAEGDGFSASIEAGWAMKAFSYGEGAQAGDVYIEPHVSVTWFGYEADPISNAVHDVRFEGKNNIRTRLGLKTFAFAKGSNTFSPFLELNWVHNTETYGAQISKIRVEQAGAEDQAEARVGMDWRINDSWTAWGHFGVSVGDDGYNAREGTLGLRCRF